MATPSISTAFIEEFESGVHMAYQRMGSKTSEHCPYSEWCEEQNHISKIGKGLLPRRVGMVRFHL